MITDGFSTDKAIIGPVDIYKERGSYFDVCICLFSPKLLEELLALYPHRQAASFGSVKGAVPVYAFEADGKTIGAFSMSVGSALAGTEIIDVNYVAGASSFVVFGSAGALDKGKIGGRYVIPTSAYRDEGMSYHYAPPSDYIELPDNAVTARIFDELNIPCVLGKTWTTDAFYRETRAKLEKRVSEGCLTVEMEMAGLAAVCSFHGFKLYSFLQAGDVLDGEEYDIAELYDANHDLRKLHIAVEIAKRV
ncbi:MAG: nucleoside phosphorylase [Clostridiales bacterium]|nr:nucleoside phosphorylase [Clostridiales bacterium]